ncbi:hypothetical protein CP967_08480 [Streptomyces nitrosporeus]|uniref:Uncharacterized protein n=1 Tax=Streptomyces nitrosporeus TaxID=28894 RepID=A0A5J6F6P8_9ACTN|nr:hypothetical protein [Streptomyces nitrosporeus]QEU71999.1 hypothetical protein CP967_08480 [Streptomyces nitrosporeus]GGY81380.1 hypothetical protein GCM10010327_10060 [Streptomyces nitrosporeus]
MRIRLPRPRRRRPAPDPAVWSLSAIVPGTRWLPCHTTVCAHTTTRHTPHGTGYRCTACGTTKGDQP